MIIALGCDHRGLNLKQSIMGFLTEHGYDYQDFGCYDARSVDYPDIAQKVAGAVGSGQFDNGILVCSTGIGMSMAANKVNKIRAALCCDTISARRSRQHNDANILCLGADIIDSSLALDIVEAYLKSTFEGSRHSQRIRKMHALEAGSLDNE